MIPAGVGTLLSKLVMLWTGSKLDGVLFLDEVSVEGTKKDVGKDRLSRPVVTRF